MIKITHIAHACFLIENGAEKLIIDPYDNSIGYDEIEETVNYVLVSHEHYDHNYTENIKVEESSGSFNIKTIDSFHDESEGSVRGKNVIHIIETDDISICHLGDLGHVLTDEQLNKIKDIDILLIPVGGTYTIDHKKAVEVVKQLKPTTIIPMHYKTPKTHLDLVPVDDFIAEIENSDYKIIKLDSNKLEYTKFVYIIIYYSPKTAL